MEDPTGGRRPSYQGAGIGDYSAVLIFVALLVVAAGIVAFQIMRFHAGPTDAMTAAQAQGPAPGPGPGEMTAGADGLLETVGHGSVVKVECSVPDSDCHKAAMEALRELARLYPDSLTVSFYQMHSNGADRAMRASGETCAGYAINGEVAHRVKRADGEHMVRFVRSPGKGEDGWTVDDLRAVVLAKLKEAGVKPSGGDVVGPPSDAPAGAPASPTT